MIHLDPDRREEAIEAAGLAVGARLNVGPEWEATAVVDDDRVVGCVLRRGREVHLGVNGRVFLRGILRAFLRPDSVTVVRESHAIGHAFVRRLGFVEVGRGGGLVHYEMKDAKHV